MKPCLVFVITLSACSPGHSERERRDVEIELRMSFGWDESEASMVDVEGAFLSTGAWVRIVSPDAGTSCDLELDLRAVRARHGFPPSVLLLDAEPVAMDTTYCNDVGFSSTVSRLEEAPWILKLGGPLPEGVVPEEFEDYFVEASIEVVGVIEPVQHALAHVVEVTPDFEARYDHSGEMDAPKLIPAEHLIGEYSAVDGWYIVESPLQNASILSP